MRLHRSGVKNVEDVQLKPQGQGIFSLFKIGEKSSFNKTEVFEVFFPLPSLPPEQNASRYRNPLYFYQIVTQHDHFFVVSNSSQLCDRH